MLEIWGSFRLISYWKRLFLSYTKVPKTTNPIAYPPLIDNREANHSLQLTMNKAAHEFLPGIQSNAMGFNSSFLELAV